MREDGYIFLSSIILMMFFILIIQVILPIFNNTILYMKDYSKYESKLIKENIINSLLISNASGDNVNIYGIDSLSIIRDLYLNPPIKYSIKFKEENKNYELLLFGEEYNEDLFKVNLLLLDDDLAVDRSELNEETIEFFIIKQ